MVTTVIRLDTTRHSIVATCTRCPSWRILRTTKTAAWREAAAHEAAWHPEARCAQDAHWKHLQRNFPQR